MATLLEKPTILIVDDVPANLSLLSDVLKSDYRTKAAINGEKALQIASSGAPPDLILLDIMMPGVDGYEVCRRLKANPATRDIPVIFVTAMGEVEDETRGLELGGGRLHHEADQRADRQGAGPDPSRVARRRRGRCNA